MVLYMRKNVRNFLKSKKMGGKRKKRITFFLNAKNGKMEQNMEFEHHLEHLFNSSNH